MTQEVYDFLMMPRRIRQQIWLAEEERRALRLSMLPSAIRYDKDKVQNCPEDPMILYIERLESVECKIKKLQSDYLVAHDNVMDQVRALDEKEGKAVMLKFIIGKSMHDTASEMHYSESQVRRYLENAGSKIKILL